MSKAKAIGTIERYGMCLTFPIDNRTVPPSLWYAFYPRSRMRWEWDDSGDNRVAELWHLREQLSRSGRVVYAKWYRGRATFFSRFLAAGLVRILNSSLELPSLPTEEAERLLGSLNESSPQSTKELKLSAELQGKFHQKTYDKALQELWNRLLVVGFGERDDGAFPSLCMGSTRLLFENVWTDARSLSAEAAWKRVERFSPNNPELKSHLIKVLRKVGGTIPAKVETAQKLDPVPSRGKRA